MAIEPLTDEAVKAWASDWANEFDQGWDEERLRTYVGKTIVLEAPGKAEPDNKGVRGKFTAKVKVIGYSVDTLVIRTEEGADPEETHRFSFLTSEGVQVALFTATTIQEDEGDQE